MQSPGSPKGFITLALIAALAVWIVVPLFNKFTAPSLAAPPAST